jgi:glycosyltransferase involved in cell wall biosynthesis
MILYDYVSPGLAIVKPDAAFPEMVIGDAGIARWRWLRRWVEHNWYCDRRNPDAGFLTRDEAAILYNAALRVRGRPCLEIGSWRGWSTVHIALGSGLLDAVDPIFAEPDFNESIRKSCSAAGVFDSVAFHVGRSPGMVDELAGKTGKKWALIFIDGDHEGDAPRLDAEAAMRHAAETAMVLFHDLASPYVAAGLDAMRNCGWRTMVYQTMQIMGVAWRGDVEPPEHFPDPGIFWTLPQHLAGYHVSRWNRPAAPAPWWPEMTMADRRDTAMMRAQVEEDLAVASMIEAELTRRQVAEHEAEIAELGERRQAELARRDAELAHRDAQLANRNAELAQLAAQLAVQRNRLWETEDTAFVDFARWMAGRRVLFGLIARRKSKRLEVVRGRTKRAQIDHLMPDEFLRRLLRRRGLLGVARRSKLAREAIVMRATTELLLRDRRQYIISAQHDLVENIISARRDLVENIISVQHDLVETERDEFIGQAAPSLASHLRLFGWGPKAPVFPRFPGRLIRECFINSKLGADAELCWVKRVINGLRLPASADELREIVARVRNSGLFDAEFYARRAGVTGPHVDPVEHYVLVGEPLRLPPSESFDATYYGERYPDVVAAGVSLLWHYVVAGQREGRHPLPLTTSVATKERIDVSRENVLLVVHGTSRTGAPILGWNLGLHLAARYNVFTVILQDDGPLADAFREQSAQLYGPFQNERSHPVDIEHGLRRLLDELNFKFAIINSVESRPVIDVCARRLIPTLLLMHEFGSLYPPGSLSKTFNIATEIVFPAQLVAKSSVELYPSLRERTIRILPQGGCALPRGRNESAAPSTPAVDLLRRIRNGGKFIVLGAGTVHYRKGVDLFLAIAAAVRKLSDGERVHFVWIGHGYNPDLDKGYSVYLHEQLCMSALEGSVTVLDEVSDLSPFYALTDAFLLTSRLDPLPNVCIDAAHRGIPIICFRGASGIGEFLVSEAISARGVLDYADVTAASREILSLACDRGHWTRVAEATKRIAEAKFDMLKYVEQIDALGTAASACAARLRQDVALLSHTNDFDQDIFVGPKPICESRVQTIFGAVAASRRPTGGHARRTSPGFDPLVWRSTHSVSVSEECKSDPLAEFVRAGRPAGAWLTSVISPTDDPIRLTSPGIRALLHVHLSDVNQAADLLVRLQSNRLPFNVSITTDTSVKAAAIRTILVPFNRGAIHVVASEIDEQEMTGWLLSELQWPETGAYDVIGHLHDGGNARDDDFIDFQWTALLGGRQPMLDQVLHAFTLVPDLGLVFACDPVLSDPCVRSEYPAGQMFWARRTTIDCLFGAGLSPSADHLSEACVVAKLTQAVTHVPGVFR